MSDDQTYTELTDKQCDEFRSMPGNFRDMVRAIHRHGYYKGALDCAESMTPLIAQVSDQLGTDECNNCDLAESAIENLKEHLAEVTRQA
ncbi:hypothetical protein [Pseudomonas putida]|uniref:Uncharacterized protein n=1 Tax=Pseudomonas putida TaxID=303 RepID=A0A8I1JHC4_PSEPU|nr:hypothetical protein [Pseudomonas putida]MBI6882531.1 hypothetical protein [Pseudomonas putida]